MGQLLEVGKLKDISDEFDLNNIVVRSEYKIQLRFTTFLEALDAFNAFQSASLPFETDNGSELTELDQKYLDKVKEMERA